MLSLIDWRRKIFEIYSDIRAESDGKIAWEKWRVKREELFKHHPESPTFNIKSIPGSYAQPILYPYNPNFCLSSKYKVLESSEILELAIVAIVKSLFEWIIFSDCFFLIKNFYFKIF